MKIGVMGVEIGEVNIHAALRCGVFVYLLFDLVQSANSFA